MSEAENALMDTMLLHEKVFVTNVMHSDPAGKFNHLTCALGAYENALTSLFPRETQTPSLAIQPEESEPAEDDE